MQSGGLIVSGSDEIIIELNNKPIRVNVEFTDQINYTPCNPHYYDQLKWNIHNNQLTVNWTVAGIREIKWSVWFYWTEISR